LETADGVSRLWSDQSVDRSRIIAEIAQVELDQTHQRLCQRWSDQAFGTIRALDTIPECCRLDSEWMGEHEGFSRIAGEGFLRDFWSYAHSRRINWGLRFL
jgi:hypothetical protein